MNESPKIRASSLHQAWNGRPVLADVDLVLAPGTVTCLLGPSGAGKTTLLRLVHGLLAPDRGEVTVDGAPIPTRGAGRRSAMRRFGYVQQRPGLVAGTVEDNVALPLRVRGVQAAAARETARSALSPLGLAEQGRRAAHTLSGGEAQRACLARAIVTDPDFLLLDEFTNQVDPDSEARMEELVLAHKQRGAAVLVITHGVAQARRLADNIVFLAEGRVREAGPAAKVLGSPQEPPTRRFLERA